MNKIESKIPFLILSLACFSILALALKIHWSDSELWSLGLARNFFSSQQASTDYKSVFNLILSAAYIPGFGNLQTIETARLIFALIGLGIAGLVYFFVVLLTQDKPAAAWTIFLYICSTLFLSQSFKIRSDILATFLQLCALYHYVWLRKQESPKQIQTYIALAINLAMLLATPKAVMHMMVNFSFIYSLEKNAPSSHGKKYLQRAFLFPGIAFLLLMLWKHEQFLSALVFFLSSFQGTEYHPAFWSAESFQSVVFALKHNWPLLLLALASFVFHFKKASTPILKSLGMASLVSIALMLLHNDRLPFFIFSILTLPFIYLGISSYTWLKSQPALSMRRLLIASITLLVMGNAALFCSQMLRDANNEIQILAVKEMETYLGRHPGTIYFDGTVVLPKDNSIYAFPAPAHYGNHEELLRIVSKPELSLIFFSTRMFFYMNDLYPVMEDHFFIQIGHGVFAKSHVVRSSHKLSFDEWKVICGEFKNPRELFVYEGKNFLSMKPVNNKAAWSCSEQALGLNSKEDFVAFTPFEPLTLPEKKSFAEIFDHNPYY